MEKTGWRRREQSNHREAKVVPFKHITNGSGEECEFFFITGATLFGFILFGKSAATFRPASIAPILGGTVGRNIGS